LLSPELQERWRNLKGKSEATAELVSSEQWMREVSDPQISIYAFGQRDSSDLGGDAHYDKLHSKYFVHDDIGFVGTTNLDYRSRVFNSEMGFFFTGDGLADELSDDFDRLKADAYLWGSPEWLELRQLVIKKGGLKGTAAKHQRALFKTLRSTGLEWFF
jgi:phosphatidylserine/phosphatidylglycerophosphate/cardiolipin synthase-like enzyme